MTGIYWHICRSFYANCMPVCHEEKCQHMSGYAVHPYKLQRLAIMIMTSKVQCIHNRILSCFKFELLQHALEHLHDALAAHLGSALVFEIERRFFATSSFIVMSTYMFSSGGSHSCAPRFWALTSNKEYFLNLMALDGWYSCRAFHTLHLDETCRQKTTPVLVNLRLVIST